MVKSVGASSSFCGLSTDVPGPWFNLIFRFFMENLECILEGREPVGKWLCYFILLMSDQL